MVIWDEPETVPLGSEVKYDCKSEICDSVIVTCDEPLTVPSGSEVKYDCKSEICDSLIVIWDEPLIVPFGRTLPAIACATDADTFGIPLIPNEPVTCKSADTL